MRGEARIPALGCGTWQLRGELCAKIVAEALRAGFRHIDTAQGYANEAAVGDGMQASGVRRDDVFVTTKVQPQLVSDGPLQRSVEEKSEAAARLRDRPPASALAQSRHSSGGEPAGARRRETPRPDAPHRRIQLHRRAARRGDAPVGGADRHQPGRIPSLSRPDESPRRQPPPPARHHRLLSGRARPGGRRPGTRCDRRRHTARPRPRSRCAGSSSRATSSPYPRTSRPERLHENLAIFDFQLTAAEMDRISLLRRPGPHLVNEPDWVPAWD